MSLFRIGGYRLPYWSPAQLDAAFWSAAQVEQSSQDNSGNNSYTDYSILYYIHNFISFVELSFFSWFRIGFWNNKKQLFKDIFTNANLSYEVSTYFGLFPFLILTFESPKLRVKGKCQLSLK